MILHILEAWFVLSIPASLLAGRFCSMNEPHEQSSKVEYSYAKAA